MVMVMKITSWETLGLNYKYKASPAAPLTINFADFDLNGKNDIVMGYYNFGVQYPVKDLAYSSQQIPELARKFPTFQKFASHSLKEIYWCGPIEQIAGI